jgi:hypothetical protein
MKAQSNSWTAIAGLHEQGYTEDFEQCGDDLLWIQQNLILHVEDFVIKEHYHFRDTYGNERMVFAITNVCSSIKGILLSKGVVARVT